MKEGESPDACPSSLLLAGGELFGPATFIKKEWVDPLFPKKNILPDRELEDYIMTSEW
jgi:hypothetical protein